MIPNHRAGFRCHSSQIVKLEPPDCGLISRSDIFVCFTGRGAPSRHDRIGSEIFGLTRPPLQQSDMD
jgi:hypothetical protein